MSRPASVWRLGVRLVFVCVNGILVGACASVPPSPAKPTGPDPVALAREGDAELERGCYQCLLAAASRYEAAIAAGAPSNAIKAAGAWALVAARERELGLPPSDALDRARGRRAVGIAEVVDSYVLIASSLPLRPEGVSKEAMEEASRALRALMGESARPSRGGIASSPDPRASSAISMIRERARLAADQVSSYLDLSVTCSGLDREALAAPRSPLASPSVPPVSGGADSSGLITFRRATCASPVEPGRRESLNRLLEGEPRFHEVHYFLGQQILAEGKLVSAEKEFFAAADGLPQMSAAWAMLGSTRLALEDYDAAAADFGRALNVAPAQREAMLNQARALNYAGRFEEALGPARRLVEMGVWYQSDANYALAYAELELRRLQDADTHVREARRTNPMHGDTARLSGLIAFQLAEFDRAQGEFELAVSRNASDCVSLLHLGMLHGQKQRLGPSVEAFVRARDCYGGAVLGEEARRTEIEASTLAEVRKDIALARVAQRIDAYRRSQASSSYGAAEGEAQRGAFDAALGHAADAERNAALGPRVVDLRARITAARARR